MLYKPQLNSCIMKKFILLRLLSIVIVIFVKLLQLPHPPVIKVFSLI